MQCHGNYLPCLPKSIASFCQPDMPFSSNTPGVIEGALTQETCGSLTNQKNATRPGDARTKSKNAPPPWQHDAPHSCKVRGLQRRVPQRIPNRRRQPLSQRLPRRALLILPELCQRLQRGRFHRRRRLRSPCERHYEVPRPLLDDVRLARTHGAQRESTRMLLRHRRLRRRRGLAAAASFAGSGALGERGGKVSQGARAERGCCGGGGALE